MIYIFEIYDRNLHQWYVDFKTKNIDIAEEYFKVLLKLYNSDKFCIKMITKFDV